MPGVGGRLLATGMALAVTLVVSQARADSGGGISVRMTADWGEALGKGMTWLAAQSERGREAQSPRRSEIASTTSTAASPGELGSAWFGVAPHVSFVARDWGGAKSLAGGPIAVTDAVRVTRSCRMVMSRIRLGEGRVVPFGQLGLGQWRVDPEWVPHLPNNVEIAGQFGAGVEFHMTPGWEIAAETGLTVLYREVHEPQQLTAPRMWGTFLASRYEF
jgi:hypothetical protein